MDPVEEIWAKARAHEAAGTFDRAAWAQLVVGARKLDPDFVGAAVQMGIDNDLFKDDAELDAVLADLPGAQG